jgi:hypothetical protein
MKNLRAVIATAVALGVGFLGFFFILPHDSRFGMFIAGAEVNVGRLLLSFSATVLGVMLGSFYRQLRALPSGTVIINDLGAFISQVFHSVDLWLGLAAAPLVYALLLKATSGMALSGLVVVALENGFCCSLIADGVLARREPEPPRQSVGTAG